ncbi:hypothetical protein E5D57_005244 [Metarhizium anisopliae]|nr:hypothetical protein E5D57_005244 [Metarhizium anisopliae]
MDQQAKRAAALSTWTDQYDQRREANLDIPSNGFGKQPDTDINISTPGLGSTGQANGQAQQQRQ